MSKLEDAARAFELLARDKPPAERRRIAADVMSILLTSEAARPAPRT